MIVARYWLTFYFYHSYIVMSGVGPVSVRFHLSREMGFALMHMMQRRMRQAFTEILSYDEKS